MKKKNNKYFYPWAANEIMLEIIDSREKTYKNLQLV